MEKPHKHAESDLVSIAALTKKYMQHPTLKVVAVLTEDVGGMTYVARWVKTDSLIDIPDNKSWAEICGDEA